MLILLATLVLCIPAYLSDSINFTDCGSSSKIINVDVSNCKAEPCPFVHKINGTINVTFVPDKTSSHPKINVYGIIGNVSFPFAYPTYACKNKYMQCPAVKGQITQFGIGMYVAPTYPQISMFLKLEIMDDDKNKLVCVAFCAIIKDPPNSSKRLTSV